MLRSRPPNCTVTNSQHIPEIEEIAPDIIFLNNFEGKIQIDGDPIPLNGTFLIHYDNDTVKINGNEFSNKARLTSNPLPAILQPFSKTNNTEEILSLQMLKQLNLNNIKQIGYAESASQLKHAVYISLITILLILSVIITRKIWSKKNTDQKPTIELTETAIEGINQIFAKPSTSNADV